MDKLRYRDIEFVTKSKKVKKYKEIKDYFLAYNSKVILNMPNLRIISDKQSSHIKFMIYCNKMCNYARKTSKIRKLVKK